MSLSCMELQLDQWLLTKGRSSTGRRLSVFCGSGNFLDPQQAGGQELGEVEARSSGLNLQGAHFLDWLVRPGIQALREAPRTLEELAAAKPLAGATYLLFCCSGLKEVGSRLFQVII